MVFGNSIIAAVAVVRKYLPLQVSLTCGRTFGDDTEVDRRINEDPARNVQTKCNALANQRDFNRPKYGRRIRIRMSVRFFPDLGNALPSVGGAFFRKIYTFYLAGFRSRQSFRL